MIVAGRDQIQGWKEIAACLGRDERTVKRWEKQRGLPVRRIPGGGRANVYLLRTELESWLAAGMPMPQPNRSTGEAEAAEGARLSTMLIEEQVGRMGPAAEPAKDVLLQPENSVRGETFDSAALRGGRDSSTAASMNDAANPDHAEERHPIRAAIFAVLAAGALAFVIAEAALDRSRNWDEPSLREQVARGSEQVAVPARSATASARQLPTAHSEADQLYLEGMYLFEQRSPESLAGARKVFEQAIATDARYAPAYSGLGETYLLLREYSTLPQAEAYRRADEAVDHALALDPNLAAAHAAKGFIDFFARWNAKEATREFETAIRLDPNSALAHHWYGSMLMHQGRPTEALSELDRAQHLSPASNAILATKALALGYGGHREEGVRLLESLERTDPSAGAPHRNLAYLSLMEPRDMPRYLCEMRRFAELRREPNTLRVLPAVAGAFRRGGEPAMWATTLAVERALHPDIAHPTFVIAQSETALGETNRALEDLSRLAQERAVTMIGMVNDPILQPLHMNPRFQQIAGSLGLVMPAEQPAPAAPSVSAPVVAARRLTEKPAVAAARAADNRQIPRIVRHAGS